MWDIPLISNFSIKFNIGLTYILVGVINVFQTSSPLNSSFRSVYNFLTKEKPFECTPEEAIPISLSPGLIFFPFIILSLSTIPTANPAISYSPSL